MNSIRQYMKDHDLDDQAMAEVISEKLGRSISAKGVQQIKTRKEAPVGWLNALGISPQEPSGLKSGKKVAGVPGTSSTPTAAPAIEPISNLPFEVVSAKATIELIYTMAGKGVAMGSRTPSVAKLWEDSAPGLADGWIEWAKENRTVANGIAMLTIGGPGGAVILTNASLLISTLMTIQQTRGIEMIPRRFVPPHENPDMTDEEIRANTEAAVDYGIRNTEG